MVLAGSGCVPVILGGAAAGGYASGQERGISGTATDAAIRVQINDLWFRYNIDMMQALDLSVREGRVLITGNVQNPEWKIEAVKLAWQANGVKEVLNEIEIRDSSSLGDYARDTWISTRLRGNLTFDSQIRSLNFSIETQNAVVFVMGVARSQAELDRVINYARNTPSVRRVVNYVRIREGEPNATPAAAPSGAPADPAPSLQPTSEPPAPSLDAAPQPGSGVPSGPAPRNAPIQVVPLS
jgi:osmotically-inducible protein OsmY